MDFERSTQARSWLFDIETLAHCRNHCAAFGSNGVSSGLNLKHLKRVRKFASGFDGRFEEGETETTLKLPSLSGQSPPLKGTCGELTVEEQTTMIRFQANQISKLVGPSAIFPELRRSSKVVSTAVMLFRRFYLSNNVLDFDCRHVATAAAYLASKVEEERVKVSSLSRPGITWIGLNFCTI